MVTTKHRPTTTHRRRWPVGTRMRLVARDALVDRMQRRDFTNRKLAGYAECAPGTIDNLVNGRTQSLQNPDTARRICEVLDVPLDVFFVPEASSATVRTTKRAAVAA